MRQFDQEWEQLVSARQWLVEQGLRLLASRGPEGMDQGFDVYAGDGIGLRIVADRGQWFVEVHPGMENLTAGGTTGWFTLEVWSSCLGSPIVLHDPRPTSTHQDQAVALESSWWLEPQLDFLQANFDQITAACSAERVETTIACLAAVQRKGSPFRPSSA